MTSASVSFYSDEIITRVFPWNAPVQLNPVPGLAGVWILSCIWWRNLELTVAATPGLSSLCKSMPALNCEAQMQQRQCGQRAAHRSNINTRSKKAHRLGDFGWIRQKKTFPNFTCWASRLHLAATYGYIGVLQCTTGRIYHFLVFEMTDLAINEPQPTPAFHARLRPYFTRTLNADFQSLFQDSRDHTALCQT